MTHTVILKGYIDTFNCPILLHFCLVFREYGCPWGHYCLKQNLFYCSALVVQAGSQNNTVDT